MEFVKFSTYLLLQCCLIANLNKTTFSASTNHIFPVNKTDLTSNNYSQSADQDLGQLRDFFMNNVEDKQICQITWLRDLIVGKAGDGIGWWSRRCYLKSAKIHDVPRKTKEVHLKDAPIEVTKEVTAELSKNYKAGQCRPIRQIVDIQSNDSSGAVFIPCAVVVKRCSGCCTSAYKECTPTKTREKPFMVMKVVPKPTKTINERRKYAVPQDSSLVQRVKVTEHNKCECQCKIKPTDCNSRQQYDEEGCSCVCPAKVKRICSSAKKIWSEKHCNCICRKVSECTTGLIFREETCSCELQNSLPRFFNLKSSNRS